MSRSRIGKSIPNPLGFRRETRELQEEEDSDGVVLACEKDKEEQDCEEDSEGEDCGETTMSVPVDTNVYSFAMDEKIKTMTAYLRDDERRTREAPQLIPFDEPSWPRRKKAPPR